MELLDRYLQAVKKHLPWQRQDDIIAELRANLESQLEEKQEELGRPLTSAEAEAWLQQLGSPVQMASHYQPQQYLIGPAIYPVYLYVLRISSMWALAIYTLVATITLVLGSSISGEAVAQAAFRLPSIVIQVAAWVTLVFAAIEFIATRYPGKCPPIAGFYANWSPSTLPPLEPVHAPGTKRPSYAQAVTEVIFGFVVLAWLVVVPRHPFLMFGPGITFLHASPFRLNPVLLTFYWWIVGLNPLQLACSCIDLLRTWQHRATATSCKVFGAIPWCSAYLPRPHLCPPQASKTDMPVRTNHRLHNRGPFELRVLCDDPSTDVGYRAGSREGFARAPGTAVIRTSLRTPGSAVPIPTERPPSRYCRGPFCRLRSASPHQAAGLCIHRRGQ